MYSTQRAFYGFPKSNFTLNKLIFRLRVYEKKIRSRKDFLEQHFQAASKNSSSKGVL